MTTRPSTDLILVPIGMILVVAAVFAMQHTHISLNGQVCNHSSTEIWLTVTESGRQGASSLATGQCSHFSTQDVEAIWGSDCSVDPCQYQAWKVGAGHYDLQDQGPSSTELVVRIHGLGAGSSWHITSEWPKPDLSSLHYSLVK